MSRRKGHPDYLDVNFFDIPGSKYVSDHIIRGRRICLRGVGVGFSAEQGKPLEMSPVIPCAGPAMKLLQKYPQLSDITFDPKKRQWKPTKFWKPKPGK